MFTQKTSFSFRATECRLRRLSILVTKDYPQDQCVIRRFSLSHYLITSYRGRPTHRHTVLIELTFPKKASKWIRVSETVKRICLCYLNLSFRHEKGSWGKDTPNGDGFAKQILSKKRRAYLHFFKIFGGHMIWGHWYPCFGLLVKSPLGFKARVGSLINIWIVHWIFYQPTWKRRRLLSFSLNVTTAYDIGRDLHCGITR